MHRSTILRLIVSSSLVAFTTGSAVGQQPARACRDCDSVARDSNRVRLILRGSSIESELERLVTQLTANRVEVEALSRRKFEQMSGLTRRSMEQQAKARTQARVIQLNGEIGTVVRQQNLLRRQLTKLCQRVVVPEGWMGVGFQATYRMLTRGSGAVDWRFEDYPTVVTVDDGSPAERAGVRRGDRILMIDGRELRDQDIVFAELLKPGERLPLRIERDGRVRDVTLLVERKPASAEVGCSSVDVRIGGLMREAPAAAIAATASAGPRTAYVGVGRGPAVAVRVPPTPRAPSAAPRIVGGMGPTPQPPDPSVVPPMPATVVFAPPSGVVTMMPSGSNSHVAVLGVDLVRLNPGLADRIGVERGVLVVEVTPGTPGADAGLVPGDVIVSSNGVMITTPNRIVQAVLRSDDRTVRFGVIRKDAKKPIDIIVSW